MLEKLEKSDKELEKEKQIDAGGGSGRTVWQME